MSNADLGYVHALARVSAKMLKAALAGDTKTMTAEQKSMDVSWRS